MKAMPTFVGFKVRSTMSRPMKFKKFFSSANQKIVTSDAQTCERFDLTQQLLVSCSTAPWVSQFPLELRSWTRFSRVKMSPRKLRSPSLAKLSSMRFLCCSTNATTKTCGRTKTSHLLWRSVSIVHFWLLPDIKVSQVSLTSKLAFRRSLYCQYFVNSRTRTWSYKWSGESTNYFLSTQLRL